jgi:hypothetical protein
MPEISPNNFLRHASLITLSNGRNSSDSVDRLLEMSSNALFNKPTLNSLMDMSIRAIMED